MTGSTALTFRYFGVVAAVSGLIYFSYEFGYVKGYKRVTGSKVPNKDKNHGLEKRQDEEKEKNVILSEPLIDSKISAIVKKSDMIA